MRKVFFLLLIVIQADVFGQDCFKIGSNKIMVERVQGQPTSINRVGYLEIWAYAYSTVTFKDDTVYEYSNNGNLKLCISDWGGLDNSKPTSKSNNATKQETENWILSKFNSYKDDKINCPSIKPSRFDSGCSTDSDYNFAFRGEYFIINYSVNGAYRKEIRIPVYDLVKLYGVGYGLSIFTHSATIYETNLKDNTKEVSDIVTIGFRCDRETNLISRLEIAFKHLGQFYSKPKNEEPF